MRTTSLVDYRTKRVLVTGGAGFIGSHLVDALVTAGAHVRVIDNLSAGRMDNLANNMDKIEFRQRDIVKADDLDGIMGDIDIVFHLAANASVPKSVQNPRHDFDSNALGTFNVLSALRDSSVATCVVASSGAVYGEPARHPIQEDDLLRPISPYGATKMAAEAFCRAFHSSFGVPVHIARIFNTYGPRQPRFVMLDFYRKLCSDSTELEILGDGKQVRDFCYVDDTVGALMHLGMLSDMPCEAFNISSGVNHSVTDVAEAMFRAMELQDVRMRFTGESWAGDAQRWEVGIDKIISHTGYRPQHDLASGLEQFVNWCRRHAERIT
jgi:UDP-glucose 4-epimerase